MTTKVASLNEVRARSLRKVVSLSGQFHANYMVAVAQLVEHQIVALDVASSTLVGHPILPISLIERAGSDSAC